MNIKAYLIKISIKLNPSMNYKRIISNCWGTARPVHTSGRHKSTPGLHQMRSDEILVLHFKNKNSLKCPDFTVIHPFSNPHILTRFPGRVPEPIPAVFRQSAGTPRPGIESALWGGCVKCRSLGRPYHCHYLWLIKIIKNNLFSIARMVQIYGSLERGPIQIWCSM